MADIYDIWTEILPTEGTWTEVLPIAYETGTDVWVEELQPMLP